MGNTEIAQEVKHNIHKACMINARTKVFPLSPTSAVHSRLLNLCVMPVIN